MVIHLGQSSIYWSYALAFICIQKPVGSKDEFHPELRKPGESLLHCMCQKTLRVEWHIPDPSLPSESQDNAEIWALMNSEQSKGKHRSHGFETAVLKKMCQPRQPEQIRPQELAAVLPWCSHVFPLCNSSPCHSPGSQESELLQSISYSATAPFNLCLPLNPLSPSKDQSKATVTSQEF